MTKKVLISPAFEEGHFDGLLDEGEYLRQSLLYKQILPRTPSRLKISMISVNPVYLVKKASCLSPFVAINPFNQRNPRLINDLRSTKEFVRKIKLFLQNEPNFRKVKFNVNKVLTMEYVQLDTWSIRKNEPKRTQNEPKVKLGKINITTCLTMNYEQRTMNDEKNEPKRTQFKTNLLDFQINISYIISKDKEGK